MTLEQWAQKQPYRLQDQRSPSLNRWIPDGSALIDRTEAFYLTDYLVSCISGGTIWFYPRHSGSALSAMLDRGTAD